jgi:hypothetical protein
VPDASTRGDVRILQAVAETDGWEWDVLVIQPGLGANRQYFPEATLRQALPLFERARVFCLDHEQHSKTGAKSARQIVGWIHQARYEDGVRGRLSLLTSADWLRRNLLDSHAKGRPDLYGLSVDAPGEAEMRRAQPTGETRETVQYFTKILPPVTVDVVWDPGTPGGFQRALNAHLTPSEEERMKDQLLKILQAKRPDLYGTIDAATVTEERLLALLAEAVPTAAQLAAVTQAQEAVRREAEARAKADADAKETARAAQSQPALSDDDKATIRQARVLSWNHEVRGLIEAAKLPEIMQASLRKRFIDQPGDQTQVTQAIAQEKETLAALSEQGKITGLGYAHEVETEGEIERIQQSMDKLFGVQPPAGLKASDAPAFTGIRQAYVRITGDTELAGRSHSPQRLDRLTQAARAAQAHGLAEEWGKTEQGLVRQSRFARIEQAQNAAAWPLILGNTLHRRLTQDYAAVDYGESRIISSRRRAADFRSLEAMRVKYAADLPTVDPETADYTEAAELGEEAVNYAVSTRGRLMTVTRKTIINDDLGAVLALPRREGRAARRTFARTVWNLAINNATYDGDSVAWFHASHANLGSTAFTADATGVATLVAALNRLMNQTEPGSAEKLGGAWWSMNITLCVPTALQDKAKQLNQSSGVPGAANEGDNPVYGLFGEGMRPERIFVNPLFTDATDWYLFRSPADMEIIEVAFLNGQETPEVFVADQQTVGQMFLADKVQYGMSTAPRSWTTGARINRSSPGKR